MYYTKLNPTTKKAQAFIESYNNSRIYRLLEAYTTCSTAKTRAEYEILNLMSNNNGSGYRILGAGSFNFSCGWMGADGLHIHTKVNHYLIPNK